MLVSRVTRRQRKWKVLQGMGGRGISKSEINGRGETAERIIPAREGREETETQAGQANVWDRDLGKAQEEVGASEDASSLGLREDFKEGEGGLLRLSKGGGRRGLWGQWVSKTFRAVSEEMGEVSAR